MLADDRMLAFAIVSILMEFNSQRFATAPLFAPLFNSVVIILNLTSDEFPLILIDKEPQKKPQLRTVWTKFVQQYFHFKNHHFVDL